MQENYLNHIIALTIRVRGLVQGVGFRPFVYRLAQQYHLNGWVVNGTDGVTIKVEGIAAAMGGFMEDLRYKAPVVSRIEEMTVDQDMPEGLNGFYILASQDMSNETSEISPDIAVCADCLADMKQQTHRINYPFINCTNCGPRFSIIMDFPYDRAKTTMMPFEMCEVCSEEYNKIADRRFHAQPVACKNCGPKYTLHHGSRRIEDFSEIITEIAEVINRHGIIALKGTGGFHLMCDALDNSVVEKLRRHKKREGKPFAVMFRDMASVKEFATVSEIEENSLTAWRRPIVILNSVKPLAFEVQTGLNTLGAFLPYMPFHYLMFEVLDTPAIVLTSGNISDEPIVTGNEEALRIFDGLADAVITYNRDIYNRTDDSVVRVINSKERVIRRSRGYVPEPVKAGFSAEGVVAAGAELSNTFCIGKADRLYLGQHIGDLKNHENFQFFEESVERFKHIFRIKPVLMACDLHPDYLSTRYAIKSGLPVIQVQHHHAHVVSCMVENGVDEPVIGLAFDGTGYGTDGNIWGSEFMVCDYNDYKRYMHFRYLPMPGGDKAAEEPWRMGISLLYQVYGSHLMDLNIPLIHQIQPGKLKTVIESISKQINCPFTSGAGRLFDAVAAISGACVNSRFHAEAPVRLESVIEEGITGHYPFELSEHIDFNSAIRAICDDVQAGIHKGIISARFHNTVAEASCRAVIQIREKTGISKVALSGGTFQNKYLSELLESLLVKNNFVVYTHSSIPCNDGGIALGQACIAAHKRKGGRE